MLAEVLHAHGEIDAAPLRLEWVADPRPAPGQVRIQVTACGVCHTDLHLIRGEVKGKLPLIPGHQVVGRVSACGEGALRFAEGTRVGVPWLNWIDPACPEYGGDRENLCPGIKFTGKDADGGYAEQMVVDENFAFALPGAFSDEQAAPLLCAGVIGYRALRLANLGRGRRLALFGFGASAHIVLQIARHWGNEVTVITRSSQHQSMARTLGAVWAGGTAAEAPVELREFDSAIIFAPVGDLVVQALEHTHPGGTVVHAGIYSSPIPSFPYELLYHERVVRSAANSTRRDVLELLQVAAEIPLQTHVALYPLAEANRALQDVHHSRVSGAAVLKI